MIRWVATVFYWVILATGTWAIEGFPRPQIPGAAPGGTRPSAAPISITRIPSGQLHLAALDRLSEPVELTPPTVLPPARPQPDRRRSDRRRADKHR